MNLATLTKEEVFSTYDLSFLKNPSFGRWHIERDLGQFIGKLCETVRPTRVLEFGGGLSTLILAEEVSKKNIGTCFSIDHLKNIQDQTKTILSQKSLNHKVHFCHFPLGFTYTGGKFFYFYKIPEEFLVQNGPFDLVLVDGPPGFYKSREAILYKVFPYLTPKAMIILDDARRPTEQTYLENWKRYFGEALQDVLFCHHFKKGLACVRVNEKCLAEPVPAEAGIKTARHFSLKERVHSFAQGMRACLSHSLHRGGL